MNAALRAAAEAVVARAAALGMRGRTLRPEDRGRIADALPLYPAWLLDLLAEVPLCGLYLGYRERGPEPEWDGLFYFEISDADSILRESLECHPGIDLVPAGYVNFGGGEGSGDPYFLCAHDGDDPPLYEVYHDVGIDAESIIAEGCKQIAPRLSDFSLAARLSGGGA